jgi:hypothetical protein
MRYAPNQRRRVLRTHMLSALERTRSPLPDDVPTCFDVRPVIKSATVSGEFAVPQGWSEIRSNGPREVARRRRQIELGMLQVTAR